MDNYSTILLDKLRFLVVGTLIIANLFLLTFLISSFDTHSVQAKSSDTSSNSVIETSDSANVVTNAMVSAANGLGQARDSVSQATNSSVQSVNRSMQSMASATTHSGRVVAHATQTGLLASVHATGKGFGFVGSTIGRSAVFVFRIPGHIVGLFSHISVINTIIRPSEHVQVPIIDPNSPELKAALAALPPAKDPAQAAPQSSAGPVWPIHGEVTTEFGVAHWPYQPTHTGLDISDGKAPGITPVRPFRPGKVIDVEHSNAGLGNHVVIDHGNGVTSVYGHLDSTAVQVGQQVDLSTIIGLEGTTGVSTGTHLHFEIRVNGQAADPHQFISGQP